MRLVTTCSPWHDMSDLLRPHQIAPAEHLKQVIKTYGSGIDESDTGTGKTYVAASIAAESRIPTLVIHPKVAHSTWHRAAEHFSDSFSQVGYEMLRTGNTPFGKWSGDSGPREVYYRCQCCQRAVDLSRLEPCYVHPQGIHCLERKTRQHSYGHFSFAPEVKQVIFDEVHRCNGLDSLNSELLISAKRQGLRILGLSATAAHSPLHMKALGYLLDLHNLKQDRVLLAGSTPLAPSKIRPSFYRWAAHYGCRRDPQFRGWKWFKSEGDQQAIMLKIREQIIPSRGVRVRCSDIPGFPDCDIQPELYDVSTSERVDQLYGEVAEAIELLKLWAQEDKAPDHPLTRILRARQELELMKVPIAEELGQDYLDKGFSVVFFVNFRQTIDELSRRFPEAPIVDGSPGSVRIRDRSVAAFQDNSKRSLIVNNAAGGVCLSMQDLDGLHPRVGLVMPCESAVTMRQLFGRLPRDGGKSTAHYRVLLADHTVERRIHRNLRAKLNNLDALNDADLNPSNLMIEVG